MSALGSRLGLKIVATFMVVVVILSALAFYALGEGRSRVIDAVGEDSVHIADFIASALDRTTYLKYHELLIQGRDTVIHDLLDDSNSEYGALSDPYDYIDSVEDEWETVPQAALSPLMEEILANEASLLLSELREHYIYEHGLDIYAWIALTNRYGAVVAMSDRTESFSQYGESWWQETVTDGGHFGDIVTDAASETTGLLVAISLTDDIGGLNGVMFAFVNIVAIASEAVFLGQVYQTTELRVVTSEGRIVYSGGAFLMLEDLSDRDFVTMATDTSGYFIVDENDHEKLFSYTHTVGYFMYDGNNLTVFLAVRTAEVLSTVQELNDRVATAFVLLIGASAAVALVFTSSISSRIGVLARAADDFSKGNLKRKVEVNGSDEVATLATTLNDMAAELDDLYEGLEARVEERTKELAQATMKLRLLGSITRHDGLNQVAVIAAWVSVLEETVTDEKGREILGRMKEAASALEKYLTFTGTYEQIGVERPTWIDLDSAITTGLFGLDMKGAELVRKVAGMHIFADPMLPRVLRNLAENSLRHGGKVSRISFEAAEGPEGLTVTYSDDGQGIPEDMKQAIFERPVKSGRRSFGLYLSREILSITGITITEVGTPGKGAVFEIKVPKGRYRQTPPRPDGAK